MTVTEFALLTLTSDELTPEFKDLCDKGKSIQDAWCKKHNPDIPAGRRERGAAMFQQVEDPSVIFATAQWASPEEHWAWVGSEENKAVMAQLLPYIHAEGDKKPIVFHIEGVIFDGSESKASLLDSAVVSVSRLSVEPDKKQEYWAGHNANKNALEDFAAPHPAAYGWRIEKEDEQTEEFLIFCGWDSVDRHNEFPKAEGFSKMLDVMKLTKSYDGKHYKRIL